MTAEEIFYQHVEGVGTKQSILDAMNHYAEFVANERVKYIIAERNELQQYKSNIQAWLRKAPTGARE